MNNIPHIKRGVVLLFRGKIGNIICQSELGGPTLRQLVKYNHGKMGSSQLLSPRSVVTNLVDCGNVSIKAISCSCI